MSLDGPYLRYSLYHTNLRVLVIRGQPLCWASSFKKASVEPRFSRGVDEVHRSNVWSTKYEGLRFVHLESARRKSLNTNKTVIPGFAGSPGLIRTGGRPINSRMLYR